MAKRLFSRDGIPGAKVGVLLSTILVTLIFLCLAFLSGGFPKSAEAAAGESAPKKNAAEWEGNRSELVKPYAGIVSTQEEWKGLWKKAFGKKSPPVNFKRYAAACVFLGHYPGWWYKIGFGEPHVSGSAIVVPYSLVDLRVELTDDGKRGAFRQYGSRGQYKMRLVEKKKGFSMKLEQVGKPQIPPRNGFDEKLEK